VICVSFQIKADILASPEDRSSDVEVIIVSSKK
jgi:hypothetical protein